MKKYFDKIYSKGFSAFLEELEERIKKDEKTFVVTANPETLMIGSELPSFDKILKSDKTIIVPDGIGVVKAANILGYSIKERVTGVELVQGLLELLNREAKSLYLLGAKAEVLEQFVLRIRKQYPNIQVVGYQNGYIQDKEGALDDAVKLNPDVVLVALGIPTQEFLINNHYDKFQKGIFIGVGGSFDVLSGVKKRAPKIFIKMNLEWLYRIACEPKRIKRFYQSNIKFITKVKGMKDKNEN